MKQNNKNNNKIFDMPLMAIKNAANATQHAN